MTEFSHLAQCEECPLNKGKRWRVTSCRGNFEAPLVIIGEAPAAEECKQGLPFVGASGRILESAFPPDITEQDYCIINAVQCRIFGKKGDAATDPRILTALRNCFPRLLAELQAHPRKAILTLGKLALKPFIGLHSGKGFSIMSMRGKLMELPSKREEGGVVYLLPAMHPAALLHGSGSYRQFKLDVNKAIDLSRGLPFTTYKARTPEVISSNELESAINEL